MQQDLGSYQKEPFGGGLVSHLACERARDSTGHKHMLALVSLPQKRYSSIHIETIFFYKKLFRALCALTGSRRHKLHHMKKFSKNCCVLRSVPDCFLSEPVMLYDVAFAKLREPSYRLEGWFEIGRAEGLD